MALSALRADSTLSPTLAYWHFLISQNVFLSKKVVCGETITIVSLDPLSKLSKRLCVEQSSSMKIVTNHVGRSFACFWKCIRFGTQNLYWVRKEFTFAENLGRRKVLQKIEQTIENMRFTYQYFRGQLQPHYLFERRSKGQQRVSNFNYGLLSEPSKKDQSTRFGIIFTLVVLS